MIQYNVMWCDVTKTHQNWTKQTEEKGPKRRPKDQRLNHSHIQESHKNTKLEAIMYTQRTWYRSVQALCLLLSPSLWIHMSFYHADLECFISWCLPSPLALRLFLPPFSQGLLSLEGRDLMETSHLWLSVLRALSVCKVWLRVSVFVPTCHRKKLLWWWLSKALVYECSRMLLGVILLLCILFV